MCGGQDSIGGWIKVTCYRNQGRQVYLGTERGRIFVVAIDASTFVTS
jgi:hypothetical protein